VDAVIARIDKDADGEDVYVDPTDEEYEQVIKAYDEIIAAEEEEAE
jgi:putative N-acetylmannosamine-6-phosphate epimerase